MRLVTASLLLVAVVTVSACPHNPPRTTAILVNHTLLSTAKSAFEAEHLLCDPTVPLTAILRTCTATAHSLGLTDLKHQQLSDAFAPVFDKAGAYADALSKLPPQTTVPPDSSGLRQTIANLQAIAGALGATPPVQHLLSSIAAIVTAVDDIEKAIKGGQPVTLVPGVLLLASPLVVAGPLDVVIPGASR